MKLLHINSYFITNKLHSELVKKLDEKGIVQNVFIPVGSKHQIGKNSIELQNYSKLIYKKCFSPITRFLWPLKMLQIWHGLKKYLMTGELPDLIHAHTLIVNGIIAYLAYLKWNIPYVVTIRNTDINLFLKKYPFFRRIAWKVLENANSIITLSPAYGQTQLKKYFSKNQISIIQKKLVINPNGINDFWIQNMSHSPKATAKPIIIFVGRVDRNKNLEALIRACEILKKNEPSLSLYIVGDGYLLKNIKKENFNIKIVFFGHISNRSKLLELYRKAHVFAMPSYTESFGLVYAEAMSQGLPVIYTKDQGFDGYFPDGEIGYAVSANNSEQIAEKMKASLSDYQNISKRAYNNVNRFSWDVVCESLINIYIKAHKPYSPKQ